MQKKWHACATMYKDTDVTPTTVSAHDSRGNDSEAERTDATPAEARRHNGLAWAKDDLVAEQHGQRYGNAGSRGRPDAEMRPAEYRT
jgi:hypothetical protein